MTTLQEFLNKVKEKEAKKVKITKRYKQSKRL